MLLITVGHQAVLSRHCPMYGSDLKHYTARAHGFLRIAVN